MSLKKLKNSIANNTIENRFDGSYGAERRGINMEKTMRYFEVDMYSTTDKNAGTYSICIRGIRKPTKEEAKEFLKNDMDSLGYDKISFINETTLEEAKNFYDMENEATFPVFR